MEWNGTKTLDRRKKKKQSGILVSKNKVTLRLLHHQGIGGECERKEEGGRETVLAAAICHHTKTKLHLLFKTEDVFL